VTHRLLPRARACSLHRSLLSLALVLAGAATVPSRASAAAASAAPTGGSWDTTQQRQVLAAGLMEASAGSFDGAGQLQAPEANAAMAALATWLQSQAQANQQAVPAPPSTGVQAAAAVAPVVAVAHTTQSPVTVAGFDRMLVEELGLGAVAAHVQATTVAAGLQPPTYFGSEVVARLLELRYEHPVGAQRLDLFPSDPLTRAEAAWSLATVMNTSTWAISSARESLSAFELPQMTNAQRQALQIAVSRIGYPYVWGGTTDNSADGLEHGGFDCSGFAWRVFKISGLAWGHAIRGRTAAEQAGEIPSSQRLRLGQLQPGDLLFFGSAHFNSKATERNIIHEGIYLGDNWVIHSSAQGVYVLPLTGSWLGSSFAWGRRVIPWRR
jgi:cell wall-associated NlpC family hydrolase